MAPTFLTIVAAVPIADMAAAPAASDFAGQPVLLAPSGAPLSPPVAEPSIAPPIAPPSSISPRFNFFTQNLGQGPSFFRSTPTTYTAFTDTGFMVSSGPRDSVSLVEVTFEGARPTAPQGASPLSVPTTVFSGPASANAPASFPNFQHLLYGDLYDGITIAFEAVDEGLKYTVEVDAGADLSQFGFSFPPATDLEILPDGQLEISTGGGNLIDAAPYGLDAGGASVACRFTTPSPQTSGIECPEWDGSQDLTIDPLIYATYYGDEGVGATDGAMHIGPDGTATLCGSTFFANIPANSTAMGAASAGGIETFIEQLSADGTTLLFASYFGGTGNETCSGIAVNASGTIFFAGSSDSFDLPTTASAYQRSNGAAGNATGADRYDMYVAAMPAGGANLTYCTYLGGALQERLGNNSLVLRPDDTVYIAGQTWSNNYPTTSGVYRRFLFAGPDIGLSRLSPNGTALQTSTYFGRLFAEEVSGLALDASDDIVIGGSTTGTINTTMGVFDNSQNGGTDGFVAKIASDMGSLQYSTYLGTGGTDKVTSVIIDQSDLTVVSGWTDNAGFPTTAGAYSRTFAGQRDAFLTRLNPGAFSLNSSTFIGGNADDSASQVLMDPTYNLVVVGNTASTDFPYSFGALNTSNNGDTDSFLAVFNTRMATLRYSTYVGGDNDDRGNHLGLDNDGGVYISGWTDSTNYPTTVGSYHPSCYACDADVYITKLGGPSPPLSLAGVGGNQHVNLTWSASASGGSAPLWSYSVFRGTSPTSLSFEAELFGTFAYMDTGLTNGLTYYYGVRGYNNLSLGQWSTIIAVVPVGAPTTPGAPSLTPADSAVVVDWNPPSTNGGSPITNYRLFRGSTQVSLIFLRDAGLSYSFSDLGLTNGQQYCYAVSAVNVLAEGNRSAATCARPAGPPTAPVIVSATPGDHNVTLVWNPPSSDGGSAIISYRIFRIAGNASFNWSYDATLGTTFVDGGLTNGNPYCYAVAAQNYIYEGPTDTPTCATPGGPPAAPTNVAVTLGDAWIRLTWVAPTYDGGVPIIGYTAVREEGAGNISSNAGMNLAYNDTGLANGTQYCYVIRARNSLAMGPPSARVCATPVGVPDVPIAVTAAPSDGLVALSWVAPGYTGGVPLVAFDIFRGADAGSLTLLASAGLNTTFNDTGVTNGVTYYYSIVARNQLYSGAGSPALSATPAGHPGPPGGVTASPSSGAVLLSWSAPSNTGGVAIVRYHVFKGDTTGTLVELGVTTSTSYNITGLTNGQMVTFAVSAENSLFTGPQSAPGSALPGGPLDPPATVTTAWGNKWLRVTWTAPNPAGNPPAKGYVILRGPSPAALERKYSVGPVLTFNDTNVTNGETYFYAIISLNSRGEGVPSPVASGVPAGPPTSPTATRASSGDGWVLVTWEAPASNGGHAVSSYIIYRQENAGQVSVVATITSGELSFNDSDVTNSFTYTYQVSAVTDAGESPKGLVVEGTPDTPAAPPPPGGGFIPAPGASLALLALGLAAAGAVLAARRRR